MMSVTPRLIPDTECVQGKCGCTTTGCWDECAIKSTQVTPGPGIIVGTGTGIYTFVSSDARIADLETALRAAQATIGGLEMEVARLTVEAGNGSEPVTAYLEDDGEEHVHPKYGRGVFFTYNCAKELRRHPAALPAERKQAERYQFLRARTVAWNALSPSGWMTGEKLDNAIDAEILATKTGSQP